MTRGTDERWVGLSAERRALLERRLEKRGQAREPSISRRSDHGPAPLSFAQQRLWLLDQFAPGNFAYNVPRALRLSGPLDIDALERALDAIVRRHEVLRTPFAWEDGGVVQVVLESPKAALARVDLIRIPPAEREAELVRRMTEELRRPFDLSRDVMLRATVFRLAPEEHALLVVTHHIASDGWSKGVLFRELGQLYDAYVAGRPSSLPDLPIQYADFAVWQRGRLQGAVLERELAYWRAHLAGAPPAVDLPVDRPRPLQQTYRGEKQYPTVPQALYRDLVELSRHEGVTLFMTLMAAFKVLLHRYTGQGDIVVGTTVAGRTRTETEGLIGFFMNTLALRTDLADDPTVRELLRRERGVALGAYDHQEMPFEKLVEELEPTRDLGRSPLVQVMFLLDTPAKTPELGGLRVESIEVDTRAAKYDLILALVEDAGELRGKIEYNTDLFDAATVTRLLGHYEALLGEMVRGPWRRISELPLLPAAERRTLLGTWNETSADYPRSACIHELFEARVAAAPDSVAVAFEGRELTYRELEKRSNQLARHLQKSGVGPGALVGIEVERSLDMVVALLAVLKAGGAYVPLDPTYPPDRIAFMVSDSGLSVLLTQQPLMASLAPHDAEVIRLDADWGVIAREDDQPLGKTASAEDLAYVIYTSGSTGRPKGVRITHRAVVNFLCSMRKRPGIDASDRLFAVTSLSFDIAGLELLLPLVNGARVVVVSREVASDGARLAEQMDAGGCTLLQATPATFRLLLEAGWQGGAHLSLLCGGEAFPPDLAGRLLDRCGALWNMYGPTETTIWSCLHQVTSQRGPVLIGRPVDNTQIYIVDARCEPVPIGVPGELLIGGDGVARGYLNRPVLTAERFIPNPFVPGGEGPLYRTGDLARYRADGNIEFLGRIDQQVKIRGTRIELGEIEAVLGKHPNLDEAVVVAIEDGQGNRSLAAYVVPDTDALTPAELRRWLRESLPEIMIPTVFVMMTALPLTPNGKIDRRALPAPAAVAAERGQRTIVAPSGHVEEALAAIWRDVLGIAAVGTDENFFELGGHSLSAMQVARRTAAELRVDLPMRKIFEAPTIAALAAMITADRGSHDEDAMTAALAELDGLTEQEAEDILARGLGGDGA